jgi:peptidoglycan/xylan/chitin deacetylase (PgdA/CDA1 family)
MRSLRPFLKKISTHVGWLTHDALFALGLRRAEAILAQPGRRILVYHGIDTQGLKTLNGRFVAAAELDAQVGFLTKNAQIVSLEDYFDKKYDASRFTVALTFDDGYRNNLRYALPVLERYAAPATFFLTSAAARGAEWLWMDFLDVATRLTPPTLEVETHFFKKKKWRHRVYFADEQGQTLADWVRYGPTQRVSHVEAALQATGAWQGAEAWADYWQLLSPSEIRTLAASPLVTIGAHGHTHCDLAVMPHEAACTELRTAKSALETLCGQPIRTLAYPFGAYTRPLLDYAQSIGFEQQFAVDFLFADDHHDPRLRERMIVNPYISMTNQWRALRAGRY